MWWFDAVVLRCAAPMASRPACRCQLGLKHGYLLTGKASSFTSRYVKVNRYTRSLRLARRTAVMQGFLSSTTGRCETRATLYLE